MSTDLRADTTVLVADDDPQTLRVLVRILEAGGYGKVLSTTDSSAVLDICLESQPGLVLLDLTMPAPNGFDLLESLREGAAGSVPTIVMISGHEHPAFAKRALEMGAKAMLTKTTPRAEILAELDVVIMAAADGG